MRILHISDLHFGIADSKKITEEEKRERAYFFEDLLVGLKKITEKSPVDYALVTGNITFEASWNGYQEAENGWRNWHRHVEYLFIRFICVRVNMSFLTEQIYRSIAGSARILGSRHISLAERKIIWQAWHSTGIFG